MKNKNTTLTLINVTLVDETIQLKLNFNTEIYIKDEVKIRLVKK